MSDINFVSVKIRDMSGNEFKFGDERDALDFLNTLTEETFYQAKILYSTGLGLSGDLVVSTIDDFETIKFEMS